MAGCTTDWTKEKKPGGGWLYNETNITYDDNLFDGLIVYYNALGEVTTWTYEDPIDGCNVVVTYMTFQDGTEATFQDGTAIQYN